MFKFPPVTDADYEAFLETLNKEVEPLPSAEVHLEEIEARKEGTAVLTLCSVHLKIVPQCDVLV